MWIWPNQSSPLKEDRLRTESIRDFPTGLEKAEIRCELSMAGAMWQWTCGRRRLEA